MKSSQKAEGAPKDAPSARTFLFFLLSISSIANCPGATGKKSNFIFPLITTTYADSLDLPPLTTFFSNRNLVPSSRMPTLVPLRAFLRELRVLCGSFLSRTSLRAFLRDLRALCGRVLFALLCEPFSATSVSSVVGFCSCISLRAFLRDLRVLCGSSFSPKPTPAKTPIRSNSSASTFQLFSATSASIPPRPLWFKLFS